MWSCVWQSQIFEKKNFCHKNWENRPKMGQKHGFLNLLENFVINFYWICSIMKVYICCIPAQIPYLGKNFFLRYWPKCSQPKCSHFWVGVVRNGWGQFRHRTLKLAVSQKWIDAINRFLACWCKFEKAKSYFNDFWVGLVKHGNDHLVHETLKSPEWVYGLSWFFACWLWCNNFWLDQHCTFYLWLLNAI